MSLQENSELGDDDLEREDRRPCFSSEFRPSSAAEWESEREAWVDKVLSGILAGRRGGFGEGIVKVRTVLQQSSALGMGGSRGSFELVSQSSRQIQGQAGSSREFVK